MNENDHSHSSKIDLETLEAIEQKIHAIIKEENMVFKEPFYFSLNTRLSNFTEETLRSYFHKIIPELAKHPESLDTFIDCSRENKFYAIEKLLLREKESLLSRMKIEKDKIFIENLKEKINT